MTWSVPSRPMVAIAAGDPEILAPVDGAGLDPALDLVEAFLDGLGLADQLLGPGIVVELGEDALACLQLLDLGLLFRRALGRLGIDPPVAGGGVPVDLDHGRGPLPAGLDLVLEHAQLLRGEVVQQRRVVEPDRAVVLLREEIAQHLAARGLVGLDADEARDRRGARDPFLGQQSLHLPCRRAVALVRHLFPGGHLAGMVGRDGEGLQHFEVDLVGAVGVEQVRCDVAEAQALLDQALGGAETRRDGGDGEAGVGELREGDHLVGGMHGDADDISPPATARRSSPDRRRPGRAPGGRRRSCRPRRAPSWRRGDDRRRSRRRRRHRPGRPCGRRGSPAGHGWRWRPSSRPRQSDRPASCARSRAQGPAGRAEPPG